MAVDTRQFDDRTYAAYMRGRRGEPALLPSAASAASVSGVLKAIAKGIERRMLALSGSEGRPTRSLSPTQCKSCLYEALGDINGAKLALLQITEDPRNPLYACGQSMQFVAYGHLILVRAGDRIGAMGTDL